jgi:predicted dehydrogenase
MNKENRRDFLKGTTGAAIGLGVLGPTSSWAGANDTIRVGVVGVRGRGTAHIESFSDLKNVEVVALCDVDENILNEQAEKYKDRLKHPVKKYVDIRDLLQDKDIDAVSIATPNHWHSIMGIWACQAGKDVYVEKPCSHNLYEGRKLVEAARKYNRIVQHGTQARSSTAFKEAMQLLKEGIIGEVYYAKGLCYKRRNTIGRKPVEPVPKGVHYDLWIGPAPERPFTQNRFHYEWHWQWNYGNGDIGNQGVHEMDIARCGLGVGLPKVAQALGSHFMFDDDQETPNTLVATFKYPDENKMLVFEVRHWDTNDEINVGGTGNVIGNVFLGSEGFMLTTEYFGYKTFLGRDRKPGPAKYDEGNPFRNFIDCVRSRRRGDLDAEILEGHLSAALCHLANASGRLERTLRFDPATEKCIGDEEADAILQGKVRGYRSPFVVPDEV